jgi:hypothetical protein
MSDAIDTLKNPTEQDLKAKEAKLRLPSKKEVIGELLSCEIVETKSSTIILLSIQNKDDEVVTVSTSPEYWKKVGKSFIEGVIVKANYEARLAGATGYEDKDGKMIAHTSDGSNLIGISRFSATAYQRMLDSLNKETDIAKLEAVEVERVSAVSAYLSAYVKR